jgi:hypothetical protein
MSLFRLLSVAVFAIALTGCASSAKIEGMTVSDNQLQTLQFDQPLHANLQLNPVNGGEATNPLWTSEIDGPAFQAALQQSLDKAGLPGKRSFLPRNGLMLTGAYSPVDRCWTALRPDQSECLPEKVKAAPAHPDRIRSAGRH